MACQAIIWTNTGMASIGSLETNLSEIFVDIKTFSLTGVQYRLANWLPALMHKSWLKDQQLNSSWTHSSAL